MNATMNEMFINSILIINKQMNEDRIIRFAKNHQAKEIENIDEWIVLEFPDNSRMFVCDQTISLNAYKQDPSGPKRNEEHQFIEYIDGNWEEFF